MKITSHRQGLACNLFGLELAGIQPTVNGQVLAEGNWAPLHANQQTGAFVFTTSSGPVFELHWQVFADRYEWQYNLLRIVTTDPVRRFGLAIAEVGPVDWYLRNGYFSWDGTYYITPDEEAAAKSVTGYAVTQLAPQKVKPSGSDGKGTPPPTVVIGFLRHETFQHVFTFSPRAAGFTLETLWDEKAAVAGRFASERLLLFGEDGAEQGLRRWAQYLAQSSSVAPRTASPQIRGWCSWYNLYAAITEENILENLRAVRKKVTEDALPMEVFQIDDGFTPEMGDWLEVKPEFPRGMKALISDIRAAGFKPGLWIAPFMVGNRSKLFAAHPDWVVKSVATGQPLAHMKFYAEFRWHKRSEEYYILDCTHPEAFAYIESVFRIWREDWGCDYFKTDFMHFGSEYGPDQAIWHQAGLTRIEIWRRMAEMIRRVIGDAFWLGCGCPLWASVGLVDGIRIGRDIGVEWSGNYSAQSLLRDQATRNFGNKLLWQADPDCILLRDRFHLLKDNEVEALAYYAGMVGGVTMTSDNLGELSRSRLKLWKDILALGPVECTYPLLGRMSGGRPEVVLLQVKSISNRESLIFIFNPTDVTVTRIFKLSDLGIGADSWLDRLDGAPAEKSETMTLSIELEAHQGKRLRATSNKAA